MQQHTIAAEITQTGVGLHSGVITHVRILPSEPGSGRYFVRVDLPDLPIIPAQVTAVNQTLLSTQLGEGEACIRTVEHLLAALVGMGVDNARIEIDGSEVPLLDGSAKVWTESIAQVGLYHNQLTTKFLWLSKSQYGFMKMMLLLAPYQHQKPVLVTKLILSYRLLVINGIVGH